MNSFIKIFCIICLYFCFFHVNYNKKYYISTLKIQNKIIHLNFFEFYFLQLIHILYFFYKNNKNFIKLILSQNIKLFEKYFIHISFICRKFDKHIIRFATNIPRNQLILKFRMGNRLFTKNFNLINKFYKNY